MFRFFQRTLEHIVDSYSRPATTFDYAYKLAREAQVDPLRESTEACREERKAMLKDLIAVTIHEALQMKTFSYIAGRRNRRTIIPVFEVKKEIPVNSSRMSCDVHGNCRGAATHVS